MTHFLIQRTSIKGSDQTCNPVELPPGRRIRLRNLQMIYIGVALGWRERKKCMQEDVFTEGDGSGAGSRRMQRDLA